MTPNWSASAIGWRIAATVTPAPDLDVRLDHLREVHAVDVVGADHDDDVGSLVPQQVEALQDRVRRSGEPALAQPLLRGNGCDVGAGDAVEPPGLRNVAVEAVRLVLRQDDDLAQSGVDEVAQREVDRGDSRRRMAPPAWRDRPSGA